jgi:hypothetical protein
MNLSPHFTLEEAMSSDTAMRLGIDNTANAQQMKNAVIAAQGMELVRFELMHAVSINSWIRGEKLEKVLTQKDYTAWCRRRSMGINFASWNLYFAHKAHPKGYAVDFTCKAFGTPAQIVAKLRESKIKYDQLICEGTWVHISFDPQCRMQCLNATFINGEPTYTEA